MLLCYICCNENINQFTGEQSFADLCKVIVDADVNIQKFGFNDSNRVRPLLVFCASEKALNHQFYQCTSPLFSKKIYIAPGMTKLERIKHKKLVDELRQRR